MAMEDEYDPFDVGGQGYVSTGGPGRGTAASKLGYTSKDVYDDDSDSIYATKVNRGMGDGSGLNFEQYKRRFGLSERNPYGTRSGFASFFDKFSKSLGGKGVSYNLAPGMAERIMRQKYSAYRNPFNDPNLPGYDPKYRTATPEEVGAGKVTRQGVDAEGTYFGPTERVNRPQGTGEMIARALMPMGTGMLDTTDEYLSSAVTPEMRAVGPQSLLGKVFQGVTGVDPQQAGTKAGAGLDSLRSRLSALSSGEAPTPSGPRFDPREMDALSAPVDVPAPPTPLPADFAGTPMTYDEVVPQTRNIPAPISIPDLIAVQRAELNRPREVGIATPTPRPARNAPNVGMSPALEDEFFTRTNFQDPDMDARASYRGSRATPVGPDMDVLGSTIDPRGNQILPTAGEGYGAFGPRTPEDLRAMGIEPSIEDLQDMDLTPAEIMMEGMRRAQQPTQVAPGGDLLAYAETMEAAGTPMVAANTSMEDFKSANPEVYSALMASREGQQLTDLERFGGFDKSKPIETFVDPETAEIKMQGYDRRGKAKGFNIDASDFFGRIDIGELIGEALQKGGMQSLGDESQRERVDRMNREFLENLEDESERRAAERGMFRNIGYRR